MRIHRHLIPASLLLCIAGLGAVAGVACAQQSAEAAAPVDAAERRAVVAELARLLDARYLFSETGARYAAALRQALDRGAYDGLSDPTAFAARLTADLQAVSPDRHLRVRAPGEPGPMRRAAASGPALEEARMIADGIAYLRFNVLPDDPETAKAARDFLLAHADARAVIIDARPTRGGTMTVMDAILPLFYSEPETLVRMDTRAAVAAEFPAPDVPTLAARPAPDGLSRRDHRVLPDAQEQRLYDAKLFYLTSNRTASAGEHLALALKHSGRATLVGETTSGAGHYGWPMPAGRFSIFVPVGRTYDPDNGRGWEATGIEPDVRVPADQALDKALELVGADPRVADTAALSAGAN